MMICGHQKIISALQKNVKNGRFVHAYLFCGPEGVGKRTVALTFIKAVQCQGEEKPCGKCQSCLQIEKNIHPDTIIFQKEGEIKISEMREIQRKMSLKPYAAPYKILLIDNAENLNQEAANSLLKFLEEPKGKAVIILIAANLKKILPTIISRTVVINFLSVSKKEMLEYFEKLDLDIKKEDLKVIINQVRGRPGELLLRLKDPKRFFEKQKIIREFEKVFLKYNKPLVLNKFTFISSFFFDRKRAGDFLQDLLFFYHDLLLFKLDEDNFVNILEKDFFNEIKNRLNLSKIKEGIVKICEAKRLLSQNINLKLILENLALSL